MDPPHPNEDVGSSLRSDLAIWAPIDQPDSVAGEVTFGSQKGEKNHGKQVAGAKFVALTVISLFHQVLVRTNKKRL